MNCLDHIFLDELLVDRHYSTASYFEHSRGGDHLLHRVHLHATHTARGTGYWRFPGNFLEYLNIVAANSYEASTLFDTTRKATNPGLVWEGWKRKTRKSMQTVELKLRRD